MELASLVGMGRMMGSVAHCPILATCMQALGAEADCMLLVTKRVLGWHVIRADDHLSAVHTGANHQLVHDGHNRVCPATCRLRLLTLRELPKLLQRRNFPPCAHRTKPLTQ